MKSKSLFPSLTGAAALLMLFAGLVFSPSAKAGAEPAAQNAAPGNIAPQIQTTPQAVIGDGLRVVTIKTEQGNVIVKLPDDIRTGDTISGTLVQEPAGATTAEIAKNQKDMRSKIVRMMLTRAANPGASNNNPTAATTPVMVTVPLSGGSTSTVQQTLKGQGNTTKIEFKAVDPTDFALSPDKYKPSDEIGTVVVPVDIAPMGSNTKPTPTPTPAKKGHGPSFLQDDDFTAADIAAVPSFVIPEVSQAGHPVIVSGPFDGSGSNSFASMVALKPSFPAARPAGDISLDVIAESPRKAIIDVPQDFTGVGRMTIQDGGTQTSGAFRNVRVDLTAPKTSLIRGETTTLHIQVSGLEGLTAPIPLTLRSTGVITMSGGPYQPLTISPAAVTAGGIYSTDRTITGIQAGGWGATATVILRDSDAGCFVRGHYHDFLARDDQDPQNAFWIDSFSGDFGATGPGGIFVDGNAKVKVKGCLIDLSFDGQGIKFDAELDACANTANATVQASKTKTKFTVTDRDIRDNVSACR